MPGRIKGKRTSGGRELSGKVARSERERSEQPRSARVPRCAATIRLFTTASRWDIGEKVAYQSSVRCRGGKPPTPSRLKE